MAGQTDTLRLVLLLLLALEAYSAAETETEAATDTEETVEEVLPTNATCGANGTHIGSQCYKTMSNKTWESATDFLQALFLDDMCDDGAALFAVQNGTEIHLKGIRENITDANITEPSVEYIFMGIGHICNRSDVANGTIMPADHKLAAKDTVRVKKEVFGKDKCTYGNGVPIVHCLVLTLESGALLSADCLQMMQSPQQYAWLCDAGTATATTTPTAEADADGKSPVTPPPDTSKKDKSTDKGTDDGSGDASGKGKAKEPQAKKADRGAGSHSSGLWQGMLIATLIIAAAAVSIVAVRQWRRRQRRLRASRFFGSRTRLNFDQLQNDVFDNELSLDDPSAPEGQVQQTAQ